MNVVSNKFGDRKSHHPTWFAFYRFGRGVEIWFGSRYFIVDFY